MPCKLKQGHEVPSTFLVYNSILEEDLSIYGAMKYVNPPSVKAPRANLFKKIQLQVLSNSFT